MASPKMLNRLAPPLMYAFRDAFRASDARKSLDLKDGSGERVLAGRRTLARGGIADITLRQELSDDLAALLNTVNLAATQDLSPYAYVEKSVVNYGLWDLTAISIDEDAVNRIGAMLKSVLAEFESRLISDSIAIERDNSIDSASLKLRFNIRAEMLATPVDLPVEFIADLEIDSGKMKISRL